MCHSFGLVWDWKFSPVEHVGLGRSIPWETWVSCRPNLLWELISSINLVGICSEWGWEAVDFTGFASCHCPVAWHAYTEEAKQMRFTSKHSIWVLSLLIIRKKNVKRKLWKGEQPSNLIFNLDRYLEDLSGCCIKLRSFSLLRASVTLSERNVSGMWVPARTRAVDHVRLFSPPFLKSHLLFLIELF